MRGEGGGRSFVFFQTSRCAEGSRCPLRYRTNREFAIRLSYSVITKCFASRLLLVGGELLEFATVEKPGQRFVARGYKYNVWMERSGECESLNDAIAEVCFARFTLSKPFTVTLHYYVINVNVPH